MSCAGACSYVRWLARERRFAEIMVILKLLTSSPSRYQPLQDHCSLELQRLIGVGIEALISIEPQDETELAEDQLSLDEHGFYTAVELRSTFESVIPTWRERGALMALAKLNTRTGHVDWAMDCVEELVEAGRSAREIAQEPALTNLKTHRRLLALLSK